MPNFVSGSRDTVATPYQSSLNALTVNGFERINTGVVDQDGTGDPIRVAIHKILGNLDKTVSKEDLATAATADKVAQRDSNGDLWANTFRGNISGNAAGFTGALQGEVTGTMFNTRLANNTAPGTYTKLTVNNRGLITSATSPTDVRQLGVTNAVTTDFSIVTASPLTGGGALSGSSITIGLNPSFLSGVTIPATAHLVPGDGINLSPQDGGGTYRLIDNLTVRVALTESSHGMLGSTVGGNTAQPAHALATTNSPGFMSSVDKQKIDALDSAGYVRGMIIMWNRPAAQIPSGWSLCFTGDTEVLLANGDSIPISEIVENRLDVEVMSFDETSGELVARRVTNWYKSPSTKEDFVILGRKSRYKSVSSSFDAQASWEHPFWSDGEWVEARNMANRKLHVVVQQPDDILYQVVLGTSLADGHLESNRLKCTHSTKQKDYIYEKARLLKALGSHVSGPFDNSASGFGAGHQHYILQTQSGRFLKDLQEDVYGSGRREITEEILAKLGPIALAFYYADNGSLSCDDRAVVPTERMQFHTEGLSVESVDLFVDWLNSQGYSCKKYYYQNRGGAFIRFDEAGTRKLSLEISPYVEPSMSYKLPSYRRKESWPYLLANYQPTLRYSVVEDTCDKWKPVTDLSPSKKNRSIYHWKYNIEVEETHTYIAGGYVCHNCNGSNGTPNLTRRFPRGAANDAELNTLVGTATHAHAVDTPGSVLTTAQLPAFQLTGFTDAQGNHYHTGSTSVDGNHNHTFRLDEWTQRESGASGGARAIEMAVAPRDRTLFDVVNTVSNAGNHGHTFTTSWAGTHSHNVVTNWIGSNFPHTHPRVTSLEASNVPESTYVYFIMKL